ncbi:restriction endonuclease [bacterium]|nr:restriction endonuclease [bacterium]
MDEKNKLFYGDNLYIIRKYIQDNSIDLIYLDPPFNSKATYNVLFEELNGKSSQAQITAFEDTWHWTHETKLAYEEIIDSNSFSPSVKEMMAAFLRFIGHNDMMAYLTMMCIRLVELKRVLKDTGSIYLHCDPTASHYLKILMDSIFDKKNYLNEIIWCYKERERILPKWNQKHDVILFYTKNINMHETFNWQDVTESYSEVTKKKFRYKDEKGYYQIRGRNIKGSPVKAADGLTPEQEKLHPGLTYRDYINNRAGVAPRDWWEIKIINKASNERMGYPTQKPIALLERIIKASSNKGDIVFDPFCGCGTTIAAAQNLKRKWIGIDITHLAIALIKKRLKDMYDLEPKKGYDVIGEPEDLNSAKELALQNRYQFQWWALSLINAQPYQDKKKGADTGIDGLIYFIEEGGETKKAIIQVKSGHVGASLIRDFCHVVDREKAVMGIFISLEEPTSKMKEEAIITGFYDYKRMKFPKIQIITIKDLLDGKLPDMPLSYAGFKQAVRHIPEQFDI